jgi:parvulin-like peptidyl-prolyl isomerase
MFGGRITAPSRRGLRRLALATGGVALVAGAFWAFRSNVLPWAWAQSAPQAGVPAPAPTAEPSTSDYVHRVVAYLNSNEAVTRQELGEYLIARCGADKLPNLLNRKIIEHACREHNVDVTTAEVEAALAEDIKALKVDQKTFVQTVLVRYHKNLYEWKEDVLRPKLMLTKLVRGRVHPTEEDVRKSFETTYGERLECRMIVWPPNKGADARSAYTRLRDNEEEFAREAKAQPTKELAPSGGRLKPFGRHVLDPKLEDAAFRLRPGEVTELISTEQGHVVLKCDKRIPADTTVSLEAVRGKLTQEVFEQKVQQEMHGALALLVKQARPQALLKPDSPVSEGAPFPPPNQVVGYYHGNQTVTREELGEYLIPRYGVDKLELMVNRRIILQACQAQNITVSKEEIDATLQQDAQALKTDPKEFEDKVLRRMGKTLYEWREDVIRPKLLLTKLCRSQVTCTEEDLRKCFEAHYGERLECRAILYPPDQAGFALGDYPTIRDSAEEFDKKAKTQASPHLAAAGGRLPTFGRHTLGDETLEREAFKLHEGEVSIVVGTPQGKVVLKCDKRIPPDTTKRLEQERDHLQKEVLEKKVQLEMQVAFKKLHEKANPRLMLKGPNQPEDLTAEARHLLADGPPLPPAPGPAGRP